MEKSKSEHPVLPFLRLLFSNCETGILNLRFLPKGGNEFLNLNEIDRITKLINRHKDKNQYFAVSLHCKFDGKKDSISLIPAVWLEHDNVTPEIEEKIRGFPLRPSIVVQTSLSTKRHYYWILKEPLSKDEILKVERTNRMLAHYFGGDLNACDASRVLRLPGTLNFKNKPPILCKVLEMIPNNQYQIDDFEILPSGEGSKPPVQKEWVDDLLKGVSKGERNSVATRLAGRYIAKGLSLEETIAILTQWNSKNKPPLPGSELRSVVESVWKTHQRKNLHNSLSGIETNDDGELGGESIETPQKKIETFQDLLEKEITPRDPIIGDGLIARKDFVIFSGPQKKGKSLASVNLAIQVARGHPWLGFDVHSPRRVGIVQQEIPEESLKERLEKMLIHIDEKDFLDRITHLTCRGLKLDSPQGLKELRHWLDQARVDLLIIDPLYQFHRGKENDPGDMSKVCQCLQDIALDYNCGVLLIHHHGKPSQVEREGGDLHRGTSLLRDATDGNWTFTKVPPTKYQLEELPSCYILLSFEQRNTLSPEPILLRLNPETLWLEIVEARERQEAKSDEVVDCLREHGGEMSNDDLITALMNKLKIGDRACRQGIYRARDEGKILAGRAQGKGNKRTWRIKGNLAEDTMPS